MISPYYRCASRAAYDQLIQEVRRTCLSAARECRQCAHECLHYGGMAKSVRILTVFASSYELHAELLAAGNHTGTREAIATGELCTLESRRIMKQTESWFGVTPLAIRCLDLCRQLEQCRRNPTETTDLIS